MSQPPEKTARYYDEVLRNLNELLTVLKENNVILKENNAMIKELVTTQREDHKTNLGIQEHVRKIRFNTQ
jgi:hypothetical protein